MNIKNSRVYEVQVWRENSKDRGITYHVYSSDLKLEVIRSTKEDAIEQFKIDARRRTESKYRETIEIRL